jgi:hypothetical protein
MNLILKKITWLNSRLLCYRFSETPILIDGLTLLCELSCMRVIFDITDELNGGRFLGENVRVSDRLRCIVLISSVDDL